MTTDKKELLPARCEECGAIHKPSLARPSSPAPVQGEEIEALETECKARGQTIIGHALKIMQLEKDCADWAAAADLERKRADKAEAALSAKPPVQSVPGLGAKLVEISKLLRERNTMDAQHELTELIKAVSLPSDPEEWQDKGDRELRSLSQEALDIALEAAMQVVTSGAPKTPEEERAMEIAHDKEYARVLVSTYLSAQSKVSAANGPRIPTPPQGEQR